MPWSHRMIHGPSGAGTRSKTTASSSPFQRIQERPVSMSYEKVMTETVTTCLLNPRVTWQLSWERIATWGRPWRRCVQHGDVLIILPFSNWSRPRLHLSDVLIRGCLTETKHTFIPICIQNSLKTLLSNWVPLSTMGSLGTPKRHKICCQKNFLTTCKVIVASGLASIHLVKDSTATTT